MFFNKRTQKKSKEFDEEINKLIEKFYILERILIDGKNIQKIFDKNKYLKLKLSDFNLKNMITKIEVEAFRKIKNGDAFNIYLEILKKKQKIYLNIKKYLKNDKEINKLIEKLNEIDLNKEDFDYLKEAPNSSEISFIESFSFTKIQSVYDPSQGGLITDKKRIKELTQYVYPSIKGEIEDILNNSELKEEINLS